MSELPLLNLEEALERMAGDKELLANLFELFQTDAPQKLASILQYESESDIYHISRKAHSLKGSSATVGAMRLNQAAQELERAAKTENMGTVTAKRQELEKICHDTLVAMRLFCAAADGAEK